MSAAEAQVKEEIKEEPNTEEEAATEEAAEAQEEGNEEGDGNAEGEGDGEGDGANGEDEDLLLLDEVGGDDKKEDEGKEDEEEGEKSKSNKEKQGGTNRLISIHEYQLDRVIDINDRTIFIGPLLLDDLKNDTLQEYMSKKAKRFYIKYDNNDGDVKGYIELLFKSEEEALEAEKDLQGFKEDTTVKQNNEEFKKSQEYKELKFGPADEGTSIKRTLVIKGTPKPITKEELLEKIPDAVHVILPKRGTPPEYPGFAFVEMPTVERADSMVDTKIEFTDKSISATLQKFDHVPSIDVLFRLIDKNGFDRQLSSPLTTPRFQRLQTLILQCHYYERCGFLVKSQKLESLKRRTEMLVSRRTEHKRLLRRFDNRKRPGPYSPRNSYPPKRPRYNSRGGFNDRGPRHDWNEGPGWGPPPLMDYGGPRGGYDDGYWGDDFGYGSYDGYDDFGRSDRGRRMPPGGPMRDRSGPRGGGNRYGSSGGGGSGNRYGGSSHSGGSGGRGGRGKRGSGYRGKY